jgi:hypothetical protein
MPTGCAAKEPLNKSPMEGVCCEMRMMARRATKVVARPRSAEQGPLWGCDRAAGCRSPAPPAPDFAQTRGDRPFRASGIVARLADIPDIGCTSLRAMHPGKPPSRPSWTCSEVPLLRRYPSSIFIACTRLAFMRPIASVSTPISSLLRVRNSPASMLPRLTWSAMPASRVTRRITIV